MRKIFTLSLVVFSMFLFTACVNEPVANFDDIETLIDEGIIAPFDPEYLQPLEHNLTQVMYGDFTHNLDLSISVEFPRTYHLHFDVEHLGHNYSWITSTAHDHGHFSGIHVRTGHSVTEGDFIASLSFSVPEPIAIARHSLQLERAQFENSFTQDRQNRRQQIEDLRLEMEIADEGDWEVIALRLERAELQYRQFLIASENRRQQFDDRLESINAPIETENLYAPVTGTVSFTTQHFSPGYLRYVIPIHMGAAGHIGRRVASIVDREYLYFVLEAPLYALLYGNVLPIFRQGGEAYFYAQISTDPLTESIDRIGLSRARLIPLEGELERFLTEVEYELGDHFNHEDPFDNISLRTRFSIPRGTNAIFLDRRAIMEDNFRNFVIVYDDGAVGRRYVTTGPTGMYGAASVIQILSGLEPGQWVVIP